MLFPAYDYPQLDRLYDSKIDEDTDEESTSPTFLMDRKADIQRAVYRLEQARSTGELSESEAELYAAFHETRLKRIMLVEAARRLGVGSGSEDEVARQAFIDLNRELFGEFDHEAYAGMLATEQRNLDAFEPQNEQATAVKRELEQFFARKDLAGKVEEELLEPELIEQLQRYILRRYETVLAVVPDGEGIVYDAEQCRELFERALEAAGLAEKGWKVINDPKKSNPATAANKQKISLPGKMARTPDELKRLIIHEMEVHARRGQNGKDADVKLLQKGTADYADVEEGLGVLLECILAGNMDNPSFHRARDRYLTAGMALGSGDTPRDSRQTFEVMWRVLAVRDARDGVIDDDVRERAMKQAYAHVENAFRGTNFAMPGIIYAKLKIYYEGLVKNADFYKHRIDNLDAAFDDAMLGKINHTDPQEVEHARNLVA